MTREIPLTRGFVALVDDDDYHAVIVEWGEFARPNLPLLSS